MLWKEIEYIKFKTALDCLRELKKKYVVKLWIENIFKKKNKKFLNKKKIKLYRIKVSELGFKKTTTLKNIYKALKKMGFKPVSPEVAIYSRFIYDEQPAGEWLRIAVPLKSMIDSDKVPHLPKLGKALGKYFLETYWAYDQAVFHPHNDFIVEKNDF